MARIRTIKPEFWDDELVGELPPLTRLVFIGCISHADDEGRMRGSAAFVRSQVFAYDFDTNVEAVEAALQQLHACGRITLYGGAQRYLLVVNFRRHQRIQRPQHSALPAPSRHNPTAPIEPCDLQAIPIQLQYRSDTAPIPVTDGVEREWNGMEKDLSESAVPNSDLSDIKEVFEHWVEKTWTGRGRRPSLDEKKRSRIRSRLKRFTVSELKSAIDGFAASPFHNGQKNGVRHLKISTIFRDDEQVETGIEKAVGSANAAAAAGDERAAALVAFYAQQNTMDGAA